MILPRSNQGQAHREVSTQEEGEGNPGHELTCYTVSQGTGGTGRDLRPAPTIRESPRLSLSTADTQGFNAQLRDIFVRVGATGQYNYRGARARVPSGLNVRAWRHYLEDYNDGGLVDFIEFGWPVHYVGGTPLVATDINHASARRFPDDVDFYVQTELGHGALAGPFDGPPVQGLHISPLMTRPKRGSAHRRVIMDLSWPKGGAVNDGVVTDLYVDGPTSFRLPTVEYMVARLLDLGPGAYMYKTDLARGYRQLRVDPGDWPLLGFRHKGAYYMDICPPFGLRTSALCMQQGHLVRARETGVLFETLPRRLRGGGEVGASSQGRFADVATHHGGLGGRRGDP